MKRHILSIALFGFVSSASAAVIPYSENFEMISAGSAPAALVNGNAAATANIWSTIVNAVPNHLFQNSLSGSASTKGFTSVQMTDLGPANPANNFKISTVVSPVSVTSGGSVNYTAGLRVLGNTASSSDDSYLADMNIGANGGRIRIVEFTGATGVVLPSSSQASQPLIPSFGFNKTYELELLGTYDLANALTLKFTVTEVGATANTQSYTMPADATPRTGQNFGLYDSMGAGGTNMVVNYDNLSIVPEPSTLALLMLGALPMLTRRRK